MQSRTIGNRKRPRHVTNKSLNVLQRLFMGDTPLNDAPLITLRHAREHSTTHQSPIDEETERYL
jgi:hypothetical protein